MRVFMVERWTAQLYVGLNRRLNSNLTTRRCGPTYCGLTLIQGRNKSHDSMLRSGRCRVGVIQLQSTPDKESSFHQADHLIKRAHGEGARVIFLPEACDYIGDSRDYTMKSAESVSGRTVEKYRGLAGELGVWLSLGGLHIKSDDGDPRISNTHLMVDDQGQLVSTYSKTHLFDVEIPGRVRLKESDYTRPGTTIGPPVHTPAGRVGLAIDMRFPELSSGLTHQGADILTFPSAFTIPTGRAHWQVLLRARAIENQCYVIAAAQVGQHHAKRASYGHAMVVDPWGEVLSDLGGEEAGYSVVDVDLDGLYKRREEMPVRDHRRYDLYGPPHLTANVAIDRVPVYQFGQVTVPSSCVFYRSPLSFAFVNKKPVIPGHVLVSPLRVVARYSELTKAELSDLAITVQTVSTAVEAHYSATSTTIGLQDGPEAGQTIQHVHYHILPRKGGDFQRNDDIYEKLETHDKNVDEREWRTEDDMVRETSTLRQLFT